MRLNASVECTLIDRSAFPSVCSGQLPLVRSYSDPGNLTIDICVPGDYATNPWTLSRDRQDLVEEIFVDVHIPGASQFHEWPSYFYNFTSHCVATTTRGYFELGNIRNNFTAGPLIDVWPDNETMWTQYNDYLNFDGGYLVPLTV